MACRGVLFAITDEQTQHLLGAAIQGDVAVEAIVEEIESAWDVEFLQETDKAWDAIHRCLSDGTLAYDGGTFPLNRVILGGQPLYEAEGYIVSFVPKGEVPDVAAALATVTEAWFRQRYFALTETNYPPGYMDEENFAAHWEYLEMLRDFYQHAAEARRAVIFTVDQ